MLDCVVTGLVTVENRVRVELQCDTGTARFTPSEAGFPAGTLDLTRLTFLEGLSCD